MFQNDFVASERFVTNSRFVSDGNPANGNDSEKVIESANGNAFEPAIGSVTGEHF